MQSNFNKEAASKMVMYILYILLKHSIEQLVSATIAQRIQEGPEELQLHQYQKVYKSISLLVYTNYIGGCKEEYNNLCI